MGNRGCGSELRRCSFDRGSSSYPDRDLGRRDLSVQEDGASCGSQELRRLVEAERAGPAAKNLHADMAERPMPLQHASASQRALKELADAHQRLVAEHRAVRSELSIAEHEGEDLRGQLAAISGRRRRLELEQRSLQAEVRRRASIVAQLRKENERLRKRVGYAGENAASTAHALEHAEGVAGNLAADIGALAAERTRLRDGIKALRAPSSGAGTTPAEVSMRQRLEAITQESRTLAGRTQSDLAGHAQSDNGVFGSIAAMERMAGVHYAARQEADVQCGLVIQDIHRLQGLLDEVRRSQASMQERIFKLEGERESLATIR